MYCCDAFKGLVSLAGKRGLSILAREDSSGRIRFVFQSRGVAYEDEGKLKPQPIDVTINIASAAGMRFCLACGQCLEEVTDASPEFFRQLASEHRKYLAQLPGL